MDFAPVRDIAMHYRVDAVAGDVPWLVLINSLGTDLRIWDAPVEQWSGRFRILRYDKRGHGLTELGDAPATIETHGADLLGLLDHLGIGRAIVCGLSIGGLIAQALHLARPGLADALIFCDTASKIGTDEMWNQRIDAVDKHGLSGMADAVMERWFTASFRTREAALLAGCRTMLLRQPAAGYAAACAAIRDADYRQTAGQIKAPTLCVVGADDLSTPRELVEAFARSIPGARFEVIPECGHIPCVEQPDRLVRIILDFVDHDPKRNSP